LLKNEYEGLGFLDYSELEKKQLEIYLKKITFNEAITIMIYTITLV